MEQLAATILHEIAAVLVPVLATALAPLLGWLVALVRRWSIDAALARALARGAGVAYLSLIEQRRGSDPGAVAAAQAEAVDFVAAAPIMAKANVSPARLDALVRAELGKLLAADPGVTVGR
jgi:hypothetical protein